MTENEKRLRTWCESTGGMARILDEVLKGCADVARAEALEEAKAALAHHRDGASAIGLVGRGAVFSDAISVIGAIATMPAPASIPVERVREVLLGSVDDCAICPSCDGSEYAVGSDAATLFCVECDDEEMFPPSDDLTLGIGEAFLRRLGVNLDGAREGVCPECDMLDAHKVQCGRRP